MALYGSRPVAYVRGVSAPPHTQPVPAETEDGAILLVLILTLLFLMFMTSVPIWFSAFIHGLA